MELKENFRHPLLPLAHPPSMAIHPTLLFKVPEITLRILFSLSHSLSHTVNLFLLSAYPRDLTRISSNSIRFFFLSLLWWSLTLLVITVILELDQWLWPSRWQLVLVGVMVFIVFVLVIAFFFCLRVGVCFFYLYLWVMLKCFPPSPFGLSFSLLSSSFFRKYSTILKLPFSAVFPLPRLSQFSCFLFLSPFFLSAVLFSLSTTQSLRIPANVYRFPGLVLFIIVTKKFSNER